MYLNNFINDNITKELMGYLEKKESHKNDFFANDFFIKEYLMYSFIFSQFS